MTSTTSGTTSFNLDVDEIIESALEPLGGEHQSGGEIQKARRLLNLLLIRLQNKNIPLSKLETITKTFQSGVSSYTLNADVNAVLKVNRSVNNIETPLTFYSQKEFHRIPNKSQSGIPNVFTVDRDITGEIVKVWPVPNDSSNSFKILVSKKIEDITASYQKIDLPTRYLPFIIDWLSYELSLTRQGIPQELRMEIKNKYEETMSDTFDEDRERADFTIRIGGISGK